MCCFDLRMAQDIYLRDGPIIQYGLIIGEQRQELIYWMRQRFRCLSINFFVN